MKQVCNLCGHEEEFPRSEILNRLHNPMPCASCLDVVSEGVEKAKLDIYYVRRDVKEFLASCVLPKSRAYTMADQIRREGYNDTPAAFVHVEVAEVPI